jgi:hypothetical protein
MALSFPVSWPLAVGLGGEWFSHRQRLIFIYEKQPRFANQTLDRIDKEGL